MNPKTKEPRPHLYLIDGSGYIFRAFHAIRNSMTNSKGLPTNAVYGYTQMLRKILNEQSPTHCVVAFDRGGAVTVATRLPLGLAGRGGWGGTRLDLPAERWRDVLTGEVTDGDLATLLATYPVALLVKEDR